MSQTLSLKPVDQNMVTTFISHAEQSKYKEALVTIHSLAVYDMLLNYLALADHNWNAFLALAEQTKGKVKERFCIEIVKDGRIPCYQYSNVTDADYDDARRFILLTLDQKQPFVKKYWNNVKERAKTVPFYPEMYRKYPNPRDRVCAIAKSHAMPPLTGPEDLRHIALFSLGGYF